MSTLFSPDSAFLQRFLRLGGYYKGDIDGLVGSKTLAAFGEFEASRRPVHLQDQKTDRHVKIHRGRTRSRFVVTPTSPRELHAWFTFFQCVIFRFCLTKNRPDAGKNQACA